MGLAFKPPIQSITGPVDFVATVVATAGKDCRVHNAANNCRAIWSTPAGRLQLAAHQTDDGLRLQLMLGDLRVWYCHIRHGATPDRCTPMVAALQITEILQGRQPRALPMREVLEL